MDVNDAPASGSSTHVQNEWKKESNKSEFYNNILNDFDTNSSSSSGVDIQIDTEKEEEEETTEDELIKTAVVKSKNKIEILEQIVIFAPENSLKTENVARKTKVCNNSEQFNCKTCDKQFKRKSSLRKHQYVHEGKFKYKCEDCDKEFIDKTKYVAHKNNHLKATPYKCKECGKGFASATYLKRHFVVHSDDFPYQCSICDQKFKWMTSYQLHQTSVHNQSKSIFECNHCLKQFYNQRILERHQRIHLTTKFKCLLCDKVQSNRKDNVMRHIRLIHTDIPRDEISSKIIVIEEEQRNEEGSMEIAIVFENTEEAVEDLSIPTNEEITIILPVPTNNRACVIQSIGNVSPLKLRSPSPVDKDKEEPTNAAPEVFIVPDSPIKVIEKIQLPPVDEIVPTAAKKASEIPQDLEKSPKTALNPKPKYNPIEHYRKMLGISTDNNPIDDDQVNAEESEDSSSIATSFPIHWRKRTSQNYFFRR
ncbi:unnamed protein product [Diamesa serratosioi]